MPTPNEKQELLKAISFAAHKHRFQRRKDSDKTPYINHPVNVALTLADAGETDQALLLAAILHDTIEDTETTADELEKNFGSEVLGIVLEVTDDKNLPKEERKRLQVVNASHKSDKAKKLKLSDKINNISDIINHPPANWEPQRKLDYLTWAENVMAGLKGSNEQLEKKLEELIEEGRGRFGTVAR